MTSYKVSGMTCQNCSHAIETALKDHAPTAQIAIDLAHNTVSVDQLDATKVAEIIEDLGFDFEGVAA